MKQDCLTCLNVLSIVMCTRRERDLAHGQNAMAQHCTAGNVKTDMLGQGCASPSCCIWGNLQLSACC